MMGRFCQLPSAAFMPRNTTLPVCEFAKTPPSESQVKASRKPPDILKRDATRSDCSGA